MAATLKTSNEDLTLDADGSGSDIKFQSNAVEKASISSAGAFTSTTIDATVLTGALPAIDGSSLTGIAGRKNMILNGAMKVAQRGTSFAAIGNGDYSLDRFRIQNNGIGAYTVTQDSTGADGFANSLKIDCTTADASPSEFDYLFMVQRIEGQDLQQLKKGTASAESVTLSFWVKCNKTGDFQVNLYDVDNTRLIGNTATINSADTWEQKSLTFAGDTTGAFNDDNGESVRLEWWFDSGSGYSSGSAPTSWGAQDSADRAVGTTLALADSTSNYINITGVQLELGTVATDFEHRSYGEELALCQRYFWQAVNGVTQELGTAFYYTSTVMICKITFPMPMRVKPTMTASAGGNEWTFYRDGAGDSMTALSLDNTNAQFTMCFVTNNNQVSGTAGMAGLLRGVNSACRLSFDSEL